MMQIMALSNVAFGAPGTHWTKIGKKLMDVIKVHGFSVSKKLLTKLCFPLFY